MKYRVHIVESERGWGQEWYHEDFDTMEAAQKYFNDTNAKNDLPYTPDWYIAALFIEKVEE